MRSRVFLLCSSAIVFIASLLIPWIVIPDNMWGSAVYASVFLFAVTMASVFMLPFALSRKGNARSIASVGPLSMLMIVMIVWAFAVLLGAVTILSEKWVWVGNIITIVLGALGGMSISTAGEHINKHEKVNPDNRFEWISMCQLLNKRANDAVLKDQLVILADAIRYSASSIDQVAKAEEDEIESILYTHLSDEVGKSTTSSTAVSLIDKINELLLIRNQKLKIARSKF